MLYLASKYYSQAASASTSSLASNGGSRGSGNSEPDAAVDVPVAGESGEVTACGNDNSDNSDLNDTRFDNNVNRVNGYREENAVSAAGAAFRAALLSNANLAGDNCNRGMMLGSILGAAFGERSIPPDLIRGLYRHDELRRTVESLADMIVASFPKQAAAAGAFPRFGRPRPLPLLRYPAASGDSAAVISAPRDFTAKLRRIQSDARRAAAGDAGEVSGSGSGRLRYVRNVGPVVLPSWRTASDVITPLASTQGGGQARVLAPSIAAPIVGGGANALAAAAMMDSGDAAADRAAALAALQAGSNGTLTSALASPAAIPAAEAASSGGSSGAFPASVRLASLDAALLDRESATNILLSAASAIPPSESHRLWIAAELQLDCVPGTGAFVYPHPAELSGRAISSQAMAPPPCATA